MRTIIGTVLALCLLAGGPALAATRPLEGKPVKFQGAANRQLSGVLVEPAGKGPFPAIVEVHAINGQGNWDMEVSKKLAAEGYVTLAVDLYGRRARDYYDGLRLRDRVRPGVPEDLRGAVRYLRTLKNVDPNRIGALGWCMGGGYVLLLAIAEPTLGAGVIYYGHVLVEPQDVAKIQAPLLGLFGQEDPTIPIPSVKMFGNMMRDAGKQFEVHIYPDSEHGFAEPEGRAYNPETASDAWQKALAFLKARLGERRTAPAAQPSR